MKRIAASILAAGLAVAGLTSCAELETFISDNFVTSEETIASTSKGYDAQPGEFGYQSDAPAPELLDELVVAEPQQNMHTYSGNRDQLYPHWEMVSESLGWTDEQSSHSCNVRWYKLWEESSTQNWDDPEKCVLANDTGWIDPYGKVNPETGEVEFISSDNPRDFDIDHIVSLADSWRTGAEGWSTEDRTRIANDPLNVIVTGAGANRAKSDSSPEQFLATQGDFYFIPLQSGVRCDIATRYTQVKHKYQLTITQGDYDALKQVFTNECAA